MKGWEPVKLATVVSLVMGQAPAASDCNKEGHGTPFVKVGEFSTERPIIREWTTDPKKIARRSDVLICVVGATCGKINLGIDAAIGRSVAAIRPKPDKIDQYYLWYFMQGKVHEMRSGSQGAAQTVISREMINDVAIPLPPLEEQRRIVAVLDEAFAAIAQATANAEKNLANAQELQSAVVSKALGSLPSQTRFRNLEEFCEPGRVITYGVIKLGDHLADGVPCLRTSNVRWLDFELEGMKCIAPELSQEYRRTILRGGEVLVNVRGTLGGVAVTTQDMIGWNVSREVAVIPCSHEHIDPDFLAFWIGTEHSQKWLTGVLKGAAYTGINISDLRTLQVPQLGLIKQQQLVSRVREGIEEARLLARNYAAKLETLAALKQSLLHRAFTGELTTTPELIPA